jgi:F-type H+-transporting ATPase subunit beta
VGFDLSLPNTGASTGPIEPRDWDARIVFDVGAARRGLYPAIDPLSSSSDLLADGRLGADHARLVREVQDLLLPGRDVAARREDDHAALSARAQRIEHFLTQPFFVAEPWSARPGEMVSLDETLAGFRALVNGDGDDLPADRLLYVGRLESVAS